MTATEAVKQPHTYGDIRALDDDTRWELIDGQAYAMTAPSWQHQSVILGLAAQLRRHFSPRCEVLPAPFDVRLPRGDESDDQIQTVVQPDISVVCDRSKLDRYGCRGTPELVIEVLSRSTAGRDHIVKRALYERHGARQYWLVHPIDRLVTIHRRPHPDQGFATPELFEARGVTTIEGYEGLEIDWDEVFAGVERDPNL